MRRQGKSMAHNCAGGAALSSPNQASTTPQPPIFSRRGSMPDPSEAPPLLKIGANSFPRDKASKLTVVGISECSFQSNIEPDGRIFRTSSCLEGLSAAKCPGQVILSGAAIFPIWAIVKKISAGSTDAYLRIGRLPQLARRS